MNCIDTIQALLAAQGLTDSACIPAGKCRVIKPYLLEKAGLTSECGTAVFTVIPYYTPACDAADRNVSVYAVGRDYHLFWQKTADRILPLLRAAYPDNTFAAFADHSPFAEVDSAARAGLGVIGENGLLLTEKYSSYVFIGCIVTDAVCDSLPAVPDEAPRCGNCGACKRACPAAQGGSCLSAVTQQKAEPTETEWNAILQNGIIWGCDVCQDVCPYTKKAKESGTIYTKIPFFYDSALPHLTITDVENTSDDALKDRAWSWRGRSVILRNLKKEENANVRKGDSPC